MALAKAIRDLAKAGNGRVLQFLLCCGADVLLDRFYGPAEQKVKAMEIAIAFSQEDYSKYKQKMGSVPNGNLATGYKCAGTFAGRNIELIYQKAEQAGIQCSLSNAVKACFGSNESPKHALLVSGFYVLHTLGAHAEAGCAPGSCETDGPLGVLALVRAFAFRGVYASLFCDMHNGPVIKSGYEAMLAYYKASDPKAAQALEKYVRCLPFVSDNVAINMTAAQYADFLRHHSTAFPNEAPNPSKLHTRAVCMVSQLASALESAWGPVKPGPIDCLFALERLGAPYRNIRGKDIGEHTEPIDCLWPLMEETSKMDAKSLAALADFKKETRMDAAATKALRGILGIKDDALTLGIGDGGNEIGMGKVAHLKGVADLSPGGEFAALSVNGTYRACDHVVVATVSNWGGTAFEMAAYAMFKPSINYTAAMRSSGKGLTDLEDKILAAIMAKPWMSVDGKYNDMPHSVDGMEFVPAHSDLYDLLWKLSGAEKA